ncbi:NUDIX domain-containing protein [Azospirillum halopraeferens]|uniref:NUDIX domain-containing protein n=1 Tax=Azospirillum halopraeferens TaxID=34010 RepID=UPI0003FEC274|nr:NUDIX hydrolase [Azospirillum halopraeferens]
MPNKTANPWTILLTRPIYENRWIRVVEHEVLNPAGKPGIYGVVHLQNLATGVIPIDADGYTTLVGQYRFPLKSYSWEIPEGGGDPGVDPLESARRELAEETGLIAREWMPLLTMHLSNSITDETAYCFLAWDLEQGVAEPEETEDLRLRRLPFAEAYAMAMRGEITDAMAVASLMKARLLALEGALPDAVAGLILR